MPDLRDHLITARHRIDDAFTALCDAERAATSPEATAMVVRLKDALTKFEDRLWSEAGAVIRAESGDDRNASR